MITRALLKSKTQATAIHVTLSLVVFAVTLFVMLAYWYPGFYFRTDGGWQGVRIMLFVDVVLGPLLTFLVFNPAKSRREMTIDFGFIGLVQVSAIVWGIYAVHAQRPLALVYNLAQFHTVRAEPLKKQNYPVENLYAYGERLPVRVFADAKTKEDSERAFQRTMQEGLSEYQQPEFYEPLKPNLETVFKDAVPIDKVAQKHPEARAEFEHLIQKHGGTMADYRLLEFAGDYAYGYLAMKTDGTVAGIIGVEPI